MQQASCCHSLETEVDTRTVLRCFMCGSALMNFGVTGPG